ncbi:MAG TPA: rhomboid family intramembrane serine protease [Ktedonobacteraceae bacterium]
MEAQTDIQTYLEQGKQALASGQAREAAVAYAHGAQLEPDNPQVHLGLAEANLALGDYSVVQMACRRVQELQPTGGIEGMIAQALLDLLDKRYDRALQYIDAVISQDPSIAYAHALRSHLLRAQGQDYDANLARARASRLSYGGRFDNCFPPLEPGYNSGYGGQAQLPQQSATPRLPGQERDAAAYPSSRSNLQRQMVRTRFMLSQNPGIFTYALIAINTVVFIISLITPQQTLDGSQISSLLITAGQINPLVQQGEYWRIFTAMFLHLSILHIALNMLSLFFIGRVVEMLYGPTRYLTIYFLGGIVGGILFFLTSPTGFAVGASGAIFSVFGALGTFYIVNRRALGSYGNGAIANWVFWVGLNLVYGFTLGNGVVAVMDHIGGLAAGMILGWLLMPRLGRRRV